MHSQIAKRVGYAHCCDIAVILRRFVAETNMNAASITRQEKRIGGHGLAHPITGPL